MTFICQACRLATYGLCAEHSCPLPVGRALPLPSLEARVAALEMQLSLLLFVVEEQKKQLRELCHTLTKDPLRY